MESQKPVETEQWNKVTGVSSVLYHFQIDKNIEYEKGNLQNLANMLEAELHKDAFKNLMRLMKGVMANACVRNFKLNKHTINTRFNMIHSKLCYFHG